jgi:hypothetical protein
MTTVATDGKAMAADGMSGTETGRVLTLQRNKLTRLPDGSIFGAAGRNSDRQKVVTWLQEGEGDKLPRLSDEFAGLRLMPGGEVLYYDPDLLPTTIDAPAAIGSGGELAVGAMLAGAKPSRAVEIAILRDNLSGGQIVSLTC